jgi:hypothetical protein
MIIKNRSTILLLVLLSALLLVLAACGGGSDSGKEPKHPVVRLQVGDKTYEENIFSYCWPASAENVVCNLNALARAQPTRASVTAGDVVRFVIGGDERAPGQFTATLLDGPGGVQDLGTSTEGVYDAALPDGDYRVQVDVVYPDVEGKQAYVSYVFGLNVAGVVVVLPTATPTETPLPSATPTETPTATLTPTPPPTSTATPKPKPTQKPTEVGTEALETPLPTGTAAPSPTQAQVAVTEPAVPSPTNTPFAIATPAQPDTPVPIVVTPASIPPLVLVFAGREYSPVGYRHCQRAESGEQVCVELPAAAPDATRIALLRAAAAQLKLTGARPSAVQIEYLSDSGVPTGQPETRPGDNTILFTVTPEQGSYILAVKITWGEVEATYFFRVSVSD